MSEHALWRGSGPDEELISGVDHLRTWKAEEIRRNLLAYASFFGRNTFLGGSRDVFAPATSGEVVAPSYLDVDVDWRVIGGDLTIQARVNVRTANAATSVTPRIKNLTDNDDIDGLPSTEDTDWEEQLITIPPPAVVGVKRYRLYLVGSNATHDIAGIGVLEIFHDMEPAT